MKRVISAIALSALFTLSMTACGFFSQDTQEIKVIPKSESANVSFQNKNASSNKEEKTDSQGSDLDNKQQSLENATQDYIKGIINDRAVEALTALKNHDMVKLSQMVHPDKGIRFSPYAYVNTGSNLVFNADAIKNMPADNKTYTWGSYDGSGEPINLTFNGYYKKFIYDEDYLHAKEVGYNKILGKGNSQNNAFEVYPNSIIVECYFPGFDPQYEGMDWKSLRLVFEKKGSTWYITGIIHDQWTI